MIITKLIRAIQAELIKEDREDVTGIAFPLTQENLKVLEAEGWKIWGWVDKSNDIVVIDKGEEGFDLVTLDDPIFGEEYVPYDIIDGVLTKLEKS